MAMRCSPSWRRAASRSARAGPTFSPYNDPDVIAGQGTVAVEILRQLVPQSAQQLDAIFVAVGGGGLIGGIGAHLKQVSPQTEVVACWPENSPALHECLRAGAIIEVAEQPTHLDQHCRRRGTWRDHARSLPADDRPHDPG